MAIETLPQTHAQQIAGQADVLIIGAGPAGCMAATTLSRYGIDFRLFDKNPLRTQTGHASGMNSF